MAGYRAWFYYAEMKADMAMQARLDKDQYDENQLVALTVSLNNPYQLEQNSFERIQGEINYRGKILKYVKRRIHDGKLVVLCIPDDPRTVLSNAKSSFGNTVNCLPNSNNSSSHPVFQKNIQGSDYINELASWKTTRLDNTSPVYGPRALGGWSEPHIGMPGKPPQNKA